MIKDVILSIEDFLGSERGDIDENTVLLAEYNLDEFEIEELSNYILDDAGLYVSPSELEREVNLGKIIINK